MTTDPVAAYTAALDAALTGPRRSKERLLAEIRDGLVDAAAPHRAAGLDPVAAVARAVGEFGEPHDLVPDCQRELTVRQTRRTAATVALCVPVLLGGWHAVWTGGHGGWHHAAVGLAAVTALGALQAVGALLLTGRWGPRRTPARLPAVTAWTATAAAVAMLLATAALAVTAGASAALALAAVAAVAGHAATAGAARTCRRCWTLVRHAAR